METSVYESNEFNLKFNEFFDTYYGIYGRRLSAIATMRKRTLTIDFQDLYDFDEKLAAKLLDDPVQITKGLSEVAFTKLNMRAPEYTEFISELQIAVRDLPFEIPLRMIGAEHIGKMVMISGIIVSASSVQPYVISATFRCTACGEISLLTQAGDQLKKPSACGACKRKGFQFLPEASHFVNVQMLTLQEMPEQLPPGQIPRSIKIRVKNDLIDVLRPGDRVVLTGVVSLIEPRRAVRTFDMLLEANHVESCDREDVDLSLEDIEEIKEIAKDIHVFSRLLQSVAPSIYGLEEVKEAILYLLSGGVPRQRDDIRIRGDLNVLLVGDPGVAKSQLLVYTANVAPRGLLTDGMGSSAAGLTASVRNDGGTFVLEAGALVLGDMGVVCIDEIDKMENEDRRAIHPAMEQQTVHVAKGGIVATLNARTSILAAANPTTGRYNVYQSVAQNINLPPTLLSRFDLIFIIRDHPQYLEDEILARHILNLHQDNGVQVAPPLSSQTLKKYIAYSKKIIPQLTKEAADRIQAFYMKMRTANTTSSAVAITIRQLESLIRVAMARARLHLRGEVLLEDAEAAIEIMTHCLQTVAIDLSTGHMDIDALVVGKPMSLQQKMGRVLALIDEMCFAVQEAVEEGKVIEQLKEEGITPEEARKVFDVLRRDGMIFYPTPGKVRALVR